MRNIQWTWVLVILVAAACLAFMPGPDIIRRCPKCGQLVEEETTASGNTFGARFWTDAKMEAPMLPDRPWLVKCPKCAHLFWIDEAERLGEKEPGEKPTTWKNTLPIVAPAEEDYYQALSLLPLDGKKERHLRIRAWQSTNDRWRYRSKRHNPTLPKRAVENLKSLYNLLDEKVENARLMKAEVARELGDFDKSIVLLNYEFDKKFAATAELIRNLAKEKNSRVEEIKR